MNPEWGRGGMYETNITGAEGVVINMSMVIQWGALSFQISLSSFLPHLDPLILELQSYTVPLTSVTLQPPIYCPLGHMD